MLSIKGGLARLALAALGAFALTAPNLDSSRVGALHDAVNASTSGNCDGYYSDTVPPSTIKVLVHNSDGSVLGVQTIPFEPYVENVLPNEWISSWDPASLESGAIAAKIYAWYWVNQGGKSQYATNYTGPCYDVRDDTFDQVYRANSARPSTTAAVQATWSTNALENGHVFQAHYCSDMNCSAPPASEGCGTDANGTPNTNGVRLSQVGSQACAQQGLTYQQILQKYYYPGLSFTTSVAPVPTLAAFQANGGQLWSIGSVGWKNWGVGMASGTSPASVMLSTGGYELAFQAYGGHLWTIGNAGWTDWRVGMAPGTSPALVALPRGGFEVAFQAYGGHLWTVGNAGWTDWGVGMAPGTSPALVALPRGGFEVAFQAYGGHLWTVGNAGWTDWGVGMAPGTSPSVSALPAGGYEVAFQAYGGQLWTVGNAGWTAWNVGIAANSSPSIAALPNGGFETAIQAYGGQLWTVGSTGTTNWGLAMAANSSPGITVQPNGQLLEAYQGADGTLWTVSSGGYAWPVGMASATSVALR